jgi:hypothetical protein
LGVALPTFVIAGVHRSGTSSLWIWLREHPDVYMSADKELEYFSYHYARGPEWYSEQFEPGRDHRARGEASPSYVYRDATMERLTTDLPDVKTIVCVRHPVDRALSHYTYQRSMGFELRELEEALRAELDSPETAGHPHLRDGRYDQFIDRLDRFVPRERQLIVLFDDLSDDPEGVFASVCEFIGVPGAIPSSVGTAFNRSTRLRSQRLRHSMLAHRPWKLLPLRFRYWIDSLNRTEAPHADLSPALRATLIDYFAPATSAVEARLGRPLPTWRI